MSEDRTPRLRRTAFVCPHCKAHAQQRWFKLGAREIAADKVPIWDVERAREIAAASGKAATDDEVAARRLARAVVTATESGSPGVHYDGDNEYMSPLLNAYISRCFACEREALWLAGKIVFPGRSVEAPPPNEDLPPPIAADYEEAATVLIQSPRAAAALLRLALQKLCSHLLDRSGGIDEMIAELVRKGLSPTIQQALDTVRVIGNESVHPGTLDMKDDFETASRLFALINVIAEGTISHPKHVAALYSMIPANKLKGIEDRNRKALAAPAPDAQGPSGGEGS